TPRQALPWKAQHSREVEQLRPKSLLTKRPAGISHLEAMFNPLLLTSARSERNGSRRREEAYKRAIRREIRLLTRLCENSEMAFWKNEKRVLGPLAAKENAPYRNCGGRFSRVAGWRGVFAQSVTSAATPFSTLSLALRRVYPVAFVLAVAEK